MSFIGRPENSPDIVYDILRLFLAVSDRTPRGIDRVDLAYARFLFGSWSGDCSGALPTPWGLRLFDREAVLRGLDRIETFWSETIHTSHDVTLSEVKRRLAGKPLPDDCIRQTDRRSAFWKLQRFLGLLSATGLSLGKSVVRAAPRDALYINVGQLGWAAPWMTAWLHHRPDIRAIFMIHDMIPLDRPELVAGPGPWSHGRMIDTAARHAAGIISTTDAAAASVQQALQRRGRPDIAVETMKLPVAAIFLERPAPDPMLTDRNYFVACGAIEPRKNLGLLLNIWRKLVAQHGDRAPKLVIAGSLGRGGQPILQAFADCAELHNHVIVARGLSSPALRDLMAHATALLMPSLAEGFGLPIIEALSLGTPVLASAIPAHLEVGGDLAIFCDPTDEAAWFRQITRLSNGGDAIARLRQRIAGYDPTTAGQHQQQIARFLRTFA